MSEPKTIGQIMEEEAMKAAKGQAPADNQIGQLLLQCPFMQARLLQQGQLTVDNLSAEAIDYLFEKVWCSELLDNQDVMQLLHISERTLLNMRSDGTLPYTHLNNKIYYYRRDLARILRNNYNGRKEVNHE